MKKTKKIISTLVAVLLTAVCMAQVPQKFNYQAIARNSTGEFIKSQVVRIEFSILDGGATGTEVYKEEHTVNTDANGLISAQVGGGTVKSGDFSKIEWSKGNMWLQTKMDAGSGFELLGAQELLSVPYAIQATYASSFKDEFGNSYKMVVDPSNNSSLSVVSTSVPNKVEIDSLLMLSSSFSVYVKENGSLDDGEAEVTIGNSIITSLMVFYVLNIRVFSVSHENVIEFSPNQSLDVIYYLWSVKYADKSASIKITGKNEAGLAPTSDKFDFIFPATTVSNAPMNVVVDQNGNVTWSTINTGVSSVILFKLDETDSKFKNIPFSSNNPRITEPGTYRLYEGDGTFASPHVEFIVP